MTKATQQAEEQQMRGAFKLLFSDKSNQFKLRENISVRVRKDGKDVNVLCRYAIFNANTGQLVFGISMRKYEAEAEKIERVIAEVKAEVKKEQEEYRSNLEVVEISHDFELGLSHLGFNRRLSGEDFEKVKKYMYRFVVEDEAMCKGEKAGWAIRRQDVNAVEEILNIAHGKRKACACAICTSAKEEKEEQAKRQAKRKELEQRLDQLFANAEKPAREECELVAKSERLLLLGAPGQQADGTGWWYHLTPTHLWRVINNATDDADWAANNYPTDGAGAIATRIERTEEVNNLLKEVEQLEH